ncbi:GNAT family acetyltransferase [Faecalimonas umbilicata]|nr:GNAT family acetyltransferase [Faecalimonas umbilicata]
MNSYAVINILDYMDVIGEDSLRTVLSEFSCPKNPEIEEFMRRNAIEFAKRKMSITYLLIDTEGRILGIFALAHKALQVMGKGLSGTVRKKIQRYAQIDDETGEFTLSAFLIGQFGKNYQYPEALPLSGIQLMDAAFGILEKVQHEIGGGVVYLECEEKPKLLEFYQSEKNRFRVFGERYSEKDGVKYIQLLKMF